jgi:predicted nucleic acid-binding protein
MTLALMKIAAGNSILYVAGHTFAEFYRDGRQTAREAQLVRTWRPEIISVTADEGILAGKLLGQTGNSNSMDAIVVAVAEIHGITEVYTGDPDDLTALRNALPRGSHGFGIVDVK